VAGAIEAALGQCTGVLTDWRRRLPVFRFSCILRCHPQWPLIARFTRRPKDLGFSRPQVAKGGWLLSGVLGTLKESWMPRSLPIHSLIPPPICKSVGSSKCSLQAVFPFAELPTLITSASRWAETKGLIICIQLGCIFTLMPGSDLKLPNSNKGVHK